MRPIDLLQVLAVVLIWGFNFVAIKTAVTEIPPLALTVIRFLLVGALLTPFFRPEKSQLKLLLLLSLTMGVGHFGLLFLGLRGADAATAALLIQLGVPFSSILAAFFFADRLGWMRAAGMGMAFVGAGLLAGEPGGGTPIAIAALLLSALCWAGSNILIKRIPQVHPMTIIGWLSLLAVPPLTMMSLVFETDQLIAIRSCRLESLGCTGLYRSGFVGHRLLSLVPAHCQAAGESGGSLYPAGTGDRRCRRRADSRRDVYPLQGAWWGAYHRRDCGDSIPADALNAIGKLTQSV